MDETSVQCEGGGVVEVAVRKILEDTGAGVTGPGRASTTRFVTGLSRAAAASFGFRSRLLSRTRYSVLQFIGEHRYPHLAVLIHLPFWLELL